MRPATPATDLNINNSVKTTVFFFSFSLLPSIQSVLFFFANDQNHTNDYTTSGVIKLEGNFQLRLTASPI